MHKLLIAYTLIQFKEEEGQPMEIRMSYRLNRNSKNLRHSGSWKVC